MIAVVQLPLWTIPAAVIVLCFAPDVAAWVRARRRARRSEARRLRALDELWSDEVGVAAGAARLAGRDSLRTAATPTYPRVVEWFHGVPREIVFARSGEPKDAA